MTHSSNALISSILDEANKKAEKVLKDAEVEKENLIQEEERKRKILLREEEENFEKKKDDIDYKTESAKRNIDRLLELKKMDVVYSAVMERVHKDFEIKVKDDSFNQTLISWITESVIGLGCKEAIIDYTKGLKLTQSTLKEVEKRAKELFKMNVSLELGSDNLKDIGIVAKDKNGGLSYSNTLEVRLRRYSREIRKLILEEDAKNNR